MIIYLLVICAFLSLAAVQIRHRYRHRRRARSLAHARVSGVVIDTDNNVDAETSYASMLQKEEQSGQRYTGKKARFMELMRVVAEGPKTIDEIEFLFEEDIQPLVRPDGLVYVPCIENEHLASDGEIELKREDLDRYIAQGLISGVIDKK
jgi:hypothetical protein